ncbi:MAG: ABC transporter permease [Acidobacteria bacterium]|nr:ABC transporter permease [Acidobacteriota bacterium]MBI3657353.1 ABC transporter permease [Acidobacteriota bacterium]
MKDVGTIPVSESLKIALLSMATHKLRTILTLLGVVIAVMTLIAVVSVIEGLNVYVAERVADMGSNVFMLDRYGLITNAEEWLRIMRRNKKITLDDYRALREKCRLPQGFAASVETNTDIKYGNQSLYDVNVTGVTASMAGIDNVQMDRGRYLSSYEVDHAQPVCIIGADVADSLFPMLNPMGKLIRIGKTPFEVIGVAKRIGKVFGETQDNFAKIPISTFQKLYGSRRSVSIRVRVNNPGAMDEAMDEVRLHMRARHHLRYNDKDDFGIITSQSFTDLWNKMTGMIALVAIFVTSVFLVVGGIVIMNIMLSVVTERTREVGLRKSLGARRQDILLQFLFESTTMATLGGSLGVFLAYLGTKLMTALTPIPSTLPVWAVVTALAVSGTVGLIFGLYPANKAAKMDPIEALRSE